MNLDDPVDRSSSVSFPHRRIRGHISISLRQKKGRVKRLERYPNDHGGISMKRRTGGIGCMLVEHM